jgi:hypothetical protein
MDRTIALGEWLLYNADGIIGEEGGTADSVRCRYALSELRSISEFVRVAL